MRSLCIPSAYPLRTVCALTLRPNRVRMNQKIIMRFEQPTICFETEDKNACLKAQSTLSDRLRRELSCGCLLLIIGVRFGTICMSVNEAKRPTFQKELFTLIKRLFKNVICLFLISVILYSLRRQNLKSDCISSWSLFTHYLSLYINAIVWLSSYDLDHV